MRPTLIALAIMAGLFAAAAAGAQPIGAAAAQQNQVFMQQEALRQQSLDLQRQAFAAQQRSQTEQAVSNLQAQRSGLSPSPLQPGHDTAAAFGANADALRVLESETAATAAHPVAKKRHRGAQRR